MLNITNELVHLDITNVNDKLCPSDVNILHLSFITFTDGHEGWGIRLPKLDQAPFHDL